MRIKFQLKKNIVMIILISSIKKQLVLEKYIKINIKMKNNIFSLNIHEQLFFKKTMHVRFR
jgi:hypothetical protein